MAAECRVVCILVKSLMEKALDAELFACPDTLEISLCPEESVLTNCPTITAKKNKCPGLIGVYDKKASWPEKVNKG